MNRYRKNAVTAGVLFLIGFSGVLTVVFFGDTLDSAANALGTAAANENRVLFGVLFNVIMALACAGIAVALYPVLRRYSPGMALSAVAFRTLESVFSLMSPIAVVVLIALSHDYISTGAADTSFYATLSGLLLSARDMMSGAITPLTWSIGAFFYHYIFFKTGIIPRWLALWGLIGVPFTVAAASLGLFQIATPQSTLDTILNLPLGLQEIPLALWLIIRGFNPSAVRELQTAPAV